MPALNFQAQFAGLVERGEKTQTIRAYRKDGRDPKPGQTLYLYTGQRTKQCRKMGEAVCKSVEVINFDERGNVTVGPNDEWWPGDFRDPYAAERRFARRDGFNTFREMRDWFEKTHGLPFEGLLIRWDPLESAA